MTYRKVRTMTVFAPGAENAPSTPWIDNEGYRIRPISTVALSSDSATWPPAENSTSYVQHGMGTKPTVQQQRTYGYAVIQNMITILLFLCQWGYQFRQSGNENFAFRRNQFTQEKEKIGHRLQMVHVIHSFPVTRDGAITSCTVLPNTPECKSRPGPEMETL